MLPTKIWTDIFLSEYGKVVADNFTMKSKKGLEPHHGSIEHKLREKDTRSVIYLEFMKTL